MRRLPSLPKRRPLASNLNFTAMNPLASKLLAALRSVLPQDVGKSDRLIGGSDPVPQHHQWRYSALVSAGLSFSTPLFQYACISSFVGVFSGRTMRKPRNCASV